MYKSIFIFQLPYHSWFDFTKEASADCDTSKWREGGLCTIFIFLFYDIAGSVGAIFVWFMVIVVRYLPALSADLRWQGGAITSKKFTSLFWLHRAWTSRQCPSLQLIEVMLMETKELCPFFDCSWLLHWLFRKLAIFPNFLIK